MRKLFGKIWDEGIFLWRYKISLIFQVTSNNNWQNVKRSTSQIE